MKKARQLVLARTMTTKYHLSPFPQMLLGDYLQEEVTPTTLANALAEELDHHKDHLDTVFKILQK